MLNTVLNPLPILKLIVGATEQGLPLISKLTFLVEETAAKQERQRLINYLEQWLLLTLFLLDHSGKIFSLIISFCISVFIKEG